MNKHGKAIFLWKVCPMLGSNGVQHGGYTGVRKRVMGCRHPRRCTVHILCNRLLQQTSNICDGRMCATGHQSIWPTNYSFTYTETQLYTELYTETQLTPLLASSHFGSLLFYCSTDGSTVLLFYWRHAKLDYIANMSRPQPITPLTWREETPNYIRRAGKLTFEIRRTVIWDSSARLVDMCFTLFIQQFSTDAEKFVFS